MLRGVYLRAAGHGPGDRKRREHRARYQRSPEVDVAADQLARHADAGRDLVRGRGERQRVDELVPGEREREEGGADERGDEVEVEPEPLVELGGADAHGDGEAGEEQDDRVQGAPPHVEVERAVGERLRVEHAVHRVGAEEAGEEEHLGGEEEPEAELAGVELLLAGAEVHRVAVALPSGLSRVDRLLGRGGFGEVYLCRRLAESSSVPVEVCIKASHRMDGWVREAYFGQLLDDHPRAIRVFEAFPLVGPDGRLIYCLVLEFARFGDLSAFLERDRTRWTERAVRREGGRRPSHVPDRPARWGRATRTPRRRCDDPNGSPAPSPAAHRPRSAPCGAPTRGGRSPGPRPAVPADARGGARTRSAARSAST